jgi:hypothetical protein
MKRILTTAVLVVLLALFFGCYVNPLLITLEKATPWDSRSVYDRGDFAQQNREVYQSLQDSNVGHEPVLSTLWWQKE